MLSLERQSARMSKITNDSLNRSDTVGVKGLIVVKGSTLRFTYSATSS